MTNLDDFEKVGFDITWKLISIGYISNSVFSKELSVDEIMDYAVDLYKADTSDKMLLDLIALEKDDAQNVINVISSLSSDENTDYSVEYKKWEVLFVWKKLSTANGDYMDFLLDLSDLWIKIGCPDNFPHVIQGVNNNLSPEDYYTFRNYKTAIEKMKQWIIREVNSINSVSANFSEE